MFGIYSPFHRLWTATDYDYAGPDWGGTCRYFSYNDALADLRQMIRDGCVDPTAYVAELPAVYVLHYTPGNLDSARKLATA